MLTKSSSANVYVFSQYANKNVLKNDENEEKTYYCELFCSINGIKAVILQYCKRL